MRGFFPAPWILYFHRVEAPSIPSLETGKCSAIFVDLYSPCIITIVTIFQEYIKWVGWIKNTMASFMKKIRIQTWPPNTTAFVSCFLALRKFLNLLLQTVKAAMININTKGVMEKSGT